MTCTFTSIAESIAADAKRLEDDLKKANARADLNQRELNRVCIERANERNRADAAELEVARLREACDSARNLADLRGQEVTKWADATGVARGERQRLRDEVERLAAEAESMVVDFGQLQIKCDEMVADAALAEATIVGLEKDRDHLQGRVKTLEELVKTYQEKEDFIERVVPEAVRQKCADYDEYRTHVDAAFKTLGKRDDESYEACAARVMQPHNEVLSDLGWSKRLYKDLAEALLPAESGHINCLREVRQLQGARAELARVREALSTLASAVTCEGKKGGGS